MAAVPKPPTIKNLRARREEILRLAEGQEARLYEADPNWRVNGQRGVIQFAG